MKVSLQWLNEFLPAGHDADEIAKLLTMTGTKVEAIELEGTSIEGVVTGKIIELVKHPDSDHLKIATVQIDEKGNVVTIVTGAPNVINNAGVLVALDGATLPDKTINTVVMRGVQSEGMMCSIQELGYTLDDFPDADANGLYLLPNDLPLGVDVRQYLGLNQTCFEFEITPNRPDCLSVQGIARELAVSMGKSINEFLPKPSYKKSSGASGQYEATIESDAPCASFNLKLVNDVKIEPSPLWLRRYLRSAGIRPINNIVDITNYVMIALGQPLHAYDAHKLSATTLTARYAKANEKLVTLDGVERQLDSNMLVIADANGPLGIAGVMGGLSSEVSAKTTAVVLEAALFDDTSIRQSAKKLGMRSEASMRFEKKVSPYHVLTALEYAAELIEKIGAGVPCQETASAAISEFEQDKIEFSWHQINALLGTKLEPSVMTDILGRLGFGFEKVSNDGATVKVPLWRPDVKIMADLAEEVARIFGYNKIEPTLQCGAKMTLGERTPMQQLRRQLARVLTGSGYSEGITFSFESPSVIKKLGLDDKALPFIPVNVRNPLGEDYSLMRFAVWPSLFQSARINQSRGITNGKLYDFASTYHFSGVADVASKMPIETPHLAGVMWSLDKVAKGELFFEAKGAIEKMLKSLNLPPLEVMPLEVSYLHPGQAAVLICQEVWVGSLGLVHPTVADAFGIDHQTVVFDLEMERLLALCSSHKGLVLPSRFPKMVRDLALVVPTEMFAATTEKLIRQYGGKLLKEVALFDVFEGKSLEPGTKSLAFKLSYFEQDRTLKEIEVTEAMNALLADLALHGLKRRD